MDSSLEKFLSKNKSINGFYSHISMIRPKGTYLFNHNDMNEFWEIYSKTITKTNYECPLGIAEKSQTYMPVVIDIDLKTKVSSEKEVKKLYTLNQVNTLIKIFQFFLKNFVKDLSDKDLTCVLLEKNPYVKKYGFNSYIKNGFHLHFPYIFLSKDDQKIFIYAQVKKYLQTKKKGSI